MVSIILLSENIRFVPASYTCWNHPISVQDFFCNWFSMYVQFILYVSKTPFTNWTLKYLVGVKMGNAETLLLLVKQLCIIVLLMKVRIWLLNYEMYCTYLDFTFHEHFSASLNIIIMYHFSEGLQHSWEWEKRTLLAELVNLRHILKCRKSTAVYLSL